MATRPTPRTRSESSVTKQHATRKRAPVLFRLPNLRSDGPHAEDTPASPPVEGSVEPAANADAKVQDADDSSEGGSRWSGPVLLVAVVGLLGAAIYFQGQQGEPNVENTMAEAGITEESLQPSISLPDFIDTQTDSGESIATSASEETIDLPPPPPEKTELLLSGNTSEPEKTPLSQRRSTETEFGEQTLSPTADGAGTAAVDLLLSSKTDSEPSVGGSERIDPPSLVGSPQGEVASVGTNMNSMVSSSLVSTPAQGGAVSSSVVAAPPATPPALAKLSEEELRNLGIPQILAARQKMFGGDVPQVAQTNNTIISTNTPDFNQSDLANLVRLSQSNQTQVNPALPRTASAPTSTVSGSTSFPQTGFGVPPAAPGYSANMQQPVNSNKNYPAYQPVFGGGVPNAGAPQLNQTQPKTYPTNVPAGQTNAVKKPYQPIGTSLNYPQ